MHNFILGVVFAVSINLITALFSREKALRLMPWLFFYLLVHGTWVLLTYNPIWNFAMDMAARQGRARTISYLLIILLGAVLAGFYWKAVNAAVDKLASLTAEKSGNSHPSSPVLTPITDIHPSLNILLYHATGGDEQGITYPSKDAWYWLISPLTVVNAGTVDETVAFELVVPVNRKNGGGHILTPLTLAQAPQNHGLPSGIGLLGVEEIRAGKSVTGSLLFKLDRGRIRRLEVQGIDSSKFVVPDVPDIVGSTIVVRSLTSGAEESFDAIALIKR